MKISKMQLIRTLCQTLFLILLIVGIYSQLRSVLFVFIVLPLIVGNFFCGWICPFGCVQDWLGKISGIFIKNKIKMPYSVQKYMQFARYILAIIALLNILPTSIPINAYMTFMQFATGEEVQLAGIIIMGSFLLISLIFDRPFCNYFCSEGIKYGIASLTRFFGIKRSEYQCVNCKKCDKACPMNIEVSNRSQVRNAQCINCFKCIDTCPKKDTLKFGRMKFNLRSAQKNQETTTNNSER